MEGRSNEATVSRYRGCLLGLAVGDALGTTLEFSPPGGFEPITDMVGGGPFGLQAGQWTDDTSMALCLAESILEAGWDSVDQLERYVRWLRDGHLSSTGRCFDIGQTVLRALGHFEKTGDPWSGPTDAYSAGNGSIMRLAPVALAFAADSARAIDRAAGLVDGCGGLVPAERIEQLVVERHLHRSHELSYVIRALAQLGQCFEQPRLGLSESHRTLRFEHIEEQGPLRVKDGVRHLHGSELREQSTPLHRAEPAGIDASGLSVRGHRARDRGEIGAVDLAQHVEVAGELVSAVARVDLELDDHVPSAGPEPEIQATAVDGLLRGALEVRRRGWSLAVRRVPQDEIHEL